MSQRLSTNDQPPEQPFENLVGHLMTQAGRTLAVAESATGGLLAASLVNVPGSSSYFLGGVVSYDNSVKERVLGVPGPMLAQYGAVSPYVAREMAQGVRSLLGADIALADTGIAGPDGGSAEKPVGLFYIALAAEGFVCERRLELTGDRNSIRAEAVQACLRLLLEYLTDWVVNEE